MKSNLFLLLLSLTANASEPFPARNLDQDLQDVIGSESEFLSSVDATNEIEDAWFLKRAMGRVRFKFAYELPVLKLEIVPELELIWDRPFPDGWVAYKH